jgi:multisubunit Na+/H+ antiporter MnhB subunit
MDIVFLIIALGAILFGIALMVLYRPGKPWNKPYLGICFSPILGGVAILLADLIPSIVGWTLLVSSVVLFWISFYDMFFREKKGITS